MRIAPVSCFAALLAIAMPGSGLAGTLHRCVDRAGHASYQSTPCDAGRRLDRTITYQPEILQAAASGRSMTRRVTRERGGARSQARYKPARTVVDACTVARTRRDAALGVNNQGGNYDVRVRHNDAVADACY